MKIENIAILCRAAVNIATPGKHNWERDARLELLASGELQVEDGDNVLVTPKGKAMIDRLTAVESPEMFWK